MYKTYVRKISLYVQINLCKKEEKVCTVKR